MMKKGKESYRRVLDKADLAIPGLSVFGHACGDKSELPVIRHRHPDKFEVVLALSGIRSFSIGAMRHTLYAGGAILVFPNEEHAAAPLDGDAGEIYWFQLDLSREADFLGYSGRESRFLLELLRGYSVRMLELPQELIDCFGEAFSLLCSQETATRLQGRALFSYSLLRLLETSPSLNVLTWEVGQAKRYIHTHLRESIDPDELQVMTGLSAKELREQFEKQLGMRPRDYIVFAKIKSACREVAEGKRSFAEIAYAYHFPSVSIFRMHFKACTGLTPSAYRRKYKKGEKV